MGLLFNPIFRFAAGVLLAAGALWFAIAAVEQRGADRALNDVRSAADKAGVLADRAADDVRRCYASGKGWSREKGKCQE